MTKPTILLLRAVLVGVLAFCPCTAAEAKAAAGIGRVDDPLAVRHPDWASLVRSIERQTREHFTLQVPLPHIGIQLTDVQRKPRSIGRAFGREGFR